MRISRYESGGAEPKPEDLQKMCKAYHVSYEWLMENEKTPMFEDGVLLLNDRESVSQRLKTIRKEKHLTQKDLAENITVQQSTISKVETQQADLTGDLANRLASYYGVGVKWPMYGDEKYKENPVTPGMIDWLWNHPEVRAQLQNRICAEEKKTV